MFEEGREYRSLNCYRSALSSVLCPIDGFDVGRHPMVCRLLKGAFQTKPPKPKYTAFWSVDQVLLHIRTWGEDQSLSLKTLTWKLAILLALSSAGRSSDLVRLSVAGCSITPERAVLLPDGLAKQERINKPPRAWSVRSFSDTLLCPVTCLKAYLERTAPFRVKVGDVLTPSSLFLAINKPHKPVASSTIARWIKSVLSSAKVDTSVFGAHSTRGASTSKAALSGITMQDILQTADWSSDSTFKQFYFKTSYPHSVSVSQSSFSKGVLEPSKSRCDMEPELSEVQS